MNVLLLEDDKKLQRITTNLILGTYATAAVSVTSSCAGAITLLEHVDFDLVVSDFNVLDGTGDRVLDWVREHRPHLVERFVFFSGNPDIHKLHHKVIEKGCMPAEFRDQLRKLMEAA